MSAFSSLPKEPVVVENLAQKSQSLSHLRSHNVVVVKNCIRSTITIRANQRAHQVIMMNCRGCQLVLLDSAVIASRTVRVFDCEGCNVVLEDVDIRRVEAWRSKQCVVTVIGDDILSEETSVTWNEGCADNKVVVADLVPSGETADSCDTDVMPIKRLATIDVPTSTTAEPRWFTNFKPVGYVHSVPMASSEALRTMASHERFIVPTFTGDGLPVSDASSDRLLGEIEALVAAPPKLSKAAIDSAYDEERKEFRVELDVIRQQAKEAAGAVRKAKYAIAFTGAGISTAAKIPDFRGPQGLWTQRDKTGSTGGKGLQMTSAVPTYSHYALTELARRGLIRFVVSTNMDGLHCRSGLPRHLIEELHGSCYTEMCPRCHTMHVRGREVNRRGGLDDHRTGARCRFCQSELEDTIVNFAETYRDMMQPVTAGFHSRKADCALVLGTSMAVQPAVTFPLKALGNPGGKMILVNMQHTPCDRLADVRVYSEIDVFMHALMTELGIEVRADAADDALPKWGAVDDLLERQAKR